METKNFKIRAIFILMTILMLSGIVCSTEQGDSLSSREISAIDTSSVAKASSAPGYCSSSGGSTTYEYISSVSYTKNPTGTMTITVNVYIANPQGCTYGKECPSYDPSPEYVNVWVDWDGDKVFKADEKVIDDALTGYLNINYRGTMTSSHVLSIPSDAVNYTWMRANLGWGTDPNDPCLSSWTWGNVVDKQIGIPTPPKIESITVEGKDAEYKDNPVANKEVVLTATITEASGYEVFKISWSGDVKEAEGPLSTYNPYTWDKPAPEDFGLKSVICKIFYKNLDTNDIGEAKMIKEFNLFFIKNGNDDSDDDPNWFEYWQKNNACPHLSECEYDKDETGFGGYDPSTDKVTLGPLAARNNEIVNISTIGACGGGLGIDCCYQTIVHELKHKWVTDNWKAGGIWNGKTDTDKDEMPDDWEDTYTYNGHKFDKNNSDTYSVHTMYSHWGGYEWYGDQEALCRIEENGKTVATKNDWAAPGKQTDPLYDGSTEVMTASINLISGFVPLGSSPEITGVTEQGIDSDSDGKYNNLRVTVTLTSDEVMSTQIIAKLLDSDQNTICTSRIYPDVVVGTQQAQLDLDGIKISNSSKNGPYTLNVSLYRIEHDAFLLDSKQVTTNAYSYTDFQPQDAVFSSVYTDQGVDTDSDGIYDQLKVNVGLTVVKTGTYNLEGWLYDSDGKDIALANKTSSLIAGSETVTLNFDGTRIGNHRKNGPYSLMYLKLADSNDEQVTFILNPHNTSAYSYTNFKKQTGVSRLTDTYTDNGTDLDLDGLYDYLTVGIGLDIVTAGDYSVTTALYGDETMISYADNRFSLTTGSQSVELNFDGLEIYNNSVDGPYTLKYVILQNENGSQIDYASDVYTTSAYSYTDFASTYIVSLTGNYSDYGTDLNSNGLYDYLTVDVGIEVASDGNCIISARLVDSNENEIVWASNTSYLTTGQPQILRLNFNGTEINANGVNGPYYIKDLYVYHTGDPEQSQYLENAHTTQTYSYTDFEGGGGCTLIGDYPPCGEVSLGEVIDFINLWAQGQASLSAVVDLINAWSSG